MLNYVRSTDTNIEIPGTKRRIVPSSRITIKTFKNIDFILVSS